MQRKTYVLYLKSFGPWAKWMVNSFHQSSPSMRLSHHYLQASPDKRCLKLSSCCLMMSKDINFVFGLITFNESLNRRLSTYTLGRAWKNVLTLHPDDFWGWPSAGWYTRNVSFRSSIQCMVQSLNVHVKWRHYKIKNSLSKQLLVFIQLSHYVNLIMFMCFATV